MHRFNGSGESHAHEPQKGVSKVTTTGEARAAGPIGSPETQVLLCRAPQWAFPQVLQEEEVFQYFLQ